MSTGLGDLDVSRETMEKLEQYAALLSKWNPRINLVSRTSLDELWSRHIMDSAQLFSLAPSKARRWTDLGSGGGFPGLVVAILAAASLPKLEVTLIESDTRKATFLRTVLRETATPGVVLSNRIESAPRQGADVVSARALAPLDTLLGYVSRHLDPNGTALLQKGAQWQKEVDIATKSWTFTQEIHKSETDPNAVILQIGDLSHG